MYPDNRILRPNYRHLLWSRYARVWYERVIDDSTLEDNMLYYKRDGILLLWPTEDTLEEIREEFKAEGISYRELMWRRQNEIEWFDRNNARDTGNGTKYHLQFKKDQINKLKKRKT